MIDVKTPIRYHKPMADEGTDWSPENEIDPAKVQREYLEVAKELIGEMKAAKEKKQIEKEKIEREMQEEIVSIPGVIGGIGIGRYKPPTFEEMSARMKRAWEETKRIAPDASDFVKAEILRTLTQAAGNDGTF